MRKQLNVMRLVNMIRTHPQMTTEHKCDRCGAQTGIYPSGQSAIERFGRENIEIVCDVCAGPALFGEPAGPGILDEIRASKPANPKQ